MSLKGKRWKLSPQNTYMISNWCCFCHGQRSRQKLITCFSWTFISYHKYDNTRKQVLKATANRCSKFNESPLNAALLLSHQFNFVVTQSTASHMSEKEGKGHWWDGEQNAEEVTRLSLRKSTKSGRLHEDVSGKGMGRTGWEYEKLQPSTVTYQKINSFVGNPANSNFTPGRSAPPKPSTQSGQHGTAVTKYSGNPGCLAVTRAATWKEGEKSFINLKGTLL